MKDRRLLVLVLAMNLFAASGCNREEGGRGEPWGKRQELGAGYITQRVPTEPTRAPSDLGSSPTPIPPISDDPAALSPTEGTTHSPTPNPIEPLLDQLDGILLEMNTVLGPEAAWQVDLP